MENEQVQEKKSFPWKVTGIIAAIVVGVILLVYMGFRIYYSNRWHAKTFVGDHNISAMTLEESKEYLNELYESYHLRIKGREGGIVVLSREDVSHEVNLDASLDTLFEEQHEHFNVFSLLRDKTLPLDANATYDKKKAQELIDNSSLITGKSYAITEPQNAKVVFSEEEKYLVIQKEVPGNRLNKEEFSTIVSEALETGLEEVDLTDAEKYPNVYKKPTLYSTDESLKAKQEACNPLVLRWMTWKMEDGGKEIVGPKLIYSWCTYKNGKASINKKKVENWVQKLCDRYDTIGIKRTFTNHAKKKIEISGGDYGWALMYDSVLKQLMTVLQKKIDPALQEEYMQDPSAKNQKALTTTKKPKYLNTAYQYDAVNRANDWDNKNFTEISLKDQKVYVWRKGKVVFSCRCISGRPVKDRQTRTGVFYVKEHQPHRVLRGDDYETPVDNWVRITWTGTGFHAAPWQSWSRWTKTYYRTRGSHGCLNLSPSDAKKIYDLVKYREPVIIY